MKEINNNSNCTIIPKIGKVNINKLNPNIYITNSNIPTNFDFVYSSLLYTNMKYRISNKIPFIEDDLTKFRDKYIKEDNKIEFYKLYKDIYSCNLNEQKNLTKYSKLFSSNKIPMPVCNYKSGFKKDGYFIIYYYFDNLTPSIKTTEVLSTFLNTDFSDFDNYFEFFTKYFLSFINLLDSTDKKYLKPNHFFEFKEIELLAKKYQKVITKEIISYQTIFKNLIDYTYNYTNDNELLETPDIFFDKMKRFFIFRKTNHSSFDCLINNIKTSSLYDVELYSNDTEKIYDKKELLRRINEEHDKISWGPQTYTTSIFSFFYYMIYTIVFNNSYAIKKCKNCEKYFFTSIDSPQLYCDNIFTGMQTCKDIGNQIAQMKKQKYDIVYGKYRGIYSKKAMLVKRNPDIKSYKIDYENWKKEAQEYRDKLKKELITNEEFEKWLDNNK